MPARSRSSALLNLSTFGRTGTKKIPVRAHAIVGNVNAPPKGEEAREINPMLSHTRQGVRNAAPDRSGAPTGGSIRARRNRFGGATSPHEIGLWPTTSRAARIRSLRISRRGSEFQSLIGMGSGPTLSRSGASRPAIWNDEAGRRTSISGHDGAESRTRMDRRGPESFVVAAGTFTHTNWVLNEPRGGSAVTSLPDRLRGLL
jgi:hypothetical protein